MKFSRVFRGYNPQDVEKYIAEQKTKQDRLLADKKQRIDELADENFTLRKNLEQYKANEQAIVRCLLQAQQCAEKLKKDAENTVKEAALRAQVFYESWQSYAQTFVSALSDDEIVQFNRIKRQFEQLLSDFNGQYAQDFAENTNAQPQLEPDVDSRHKENFGAQSAVRQTTVESESAHGGKKLPLWEANPLEKLKAATQQPHEQQTAQQYQFQKDIHRKECSAQAIGEHSQGDFSNTPVIDLDELSRPTETLAELCRALGLNVQK